MISIIPAQSGGGLDVPLHDGEWPYVVVAMNGDTYFADSATEILEATLPDYASYALFNERGERESFDEGDDLALIARYDDLVQQAAIIQEAIIVTAIEDGSFDPATVSEDELTALFTEKITPFFGIPLSDDPDDSRLNLEWNLSVPLVLLRNNYEPYTTRPLPAGNIVWLDPSTEMTYLQSLHAVGVLTMMEHSK